MNERRRSDHERPGHPIASPIEEHLETRAISRALRARRACIVRAVASCSRAVRPMIQSIVDDLLKRHRAPSRTAHLGVVSSSERVDLNDIAEVIGARAVTY